MIIGAGYIVQAILLAGLVYVILRNSEQLLNYFDQETEESDDSSQDLPSANFHPAEPGPPPV